jgi:carbon-monoxide dehydrogenase medium subunit
MKPPPFDYVDPPTLEAVLDHLAEAGENALVIAGGQSLVPLLSMRLARPDVVVDPRRVDALRRWRLDAGVLEVGALTTAATLEDSAEVAAALPALADALRLVGHLQIRTRTTIGGSLAHADPAAELPAVLLACDGSVTLQSRDRGRRTVPADDFLIGPFTTARQPDELLVSATFPQRRGWSRTVEVARRPGDFAMVGAVVAVDDTGPAGEVVDARVVLFGVAGRALRMRAAERALEGAPLDDERIEAAVAAMEGELDPAGDVHASAPYRRHVAGTVVRRALRQGGALHGA